IGRADLLDDARLNDAAGRVRHRDIVEAAVREWSSRQEPQQLVVQLQAAGVPAGRMLRLPDLDSDEHLRSRNFFRELHQPGYDAPFPTENAPVLALNMPEPEIRPAPLQGEHTREIVSRLLGLGDDEIQALIDSGDLEEAAAP